MPRFTDEWVIDRVLFDYVSGGQCACCGLQHMFLPNGTADLINAISDLETDAAHAEVAAHLSQHHHPWPVELRDQVWADRVRLRQKLKRNRSTYTDFWKQHGVAFREWCYNGNDDDDNGGGECLQNQAARWLQLPRSEVMEIIRDTYNIHSAFAVVLCTVLEQVAAFDLTQYPEDGRGEIEVNFERLLKFDRRGGFTLSLSSTNDNAGSASNPTRTWNKENLEIWLKRMESLGGPKLLERGPSKSAAAASTGDNNDDNDEEEEEEGGGADDVQEQQQQQASKSACSSFQSDRRILRLLIARYWADIFQKKYLASIANNRDK